MELVFRSKGLPASNNPDDIPRLQELSRRDAQLHLAYISPISRLYLPDISHNLTISPQYLEARRAAPSRLYLPYISPIPTRYLPYISRYLPYISRRDAELHLAYAAQVKARARARGRVRVTKPWVRARARVSTGAASRPRGISPR